MIVRRPLVVLLRSVAVFASLGLFAPVASAQLINGDDVASRILQRQLPSAPSFPDDRVPMEGPIDPGSYIVGPGDGFEVVIGGRFSVSRKIWVSADGTLVVPDVGSFDVADRSLRDVQRELRAGVQRNFRNVETDIVLAEPRQFYVHVSGAVLIPGRHVMTPIARVDDALAAAMGGVRPQQLVGSSISRQALTARANTTSEALTLEPGNLTPTRPLIPESDYIPAFRNVLVTHRDGTTDRVDLLRYYSTGSVEANPYLRDGDAISVQFFNPTATSVAVAGAVAEPGVYDYRPDDTALSLLLVAVGANVAEQVNEVRLLRSAGGTSREFTLRAGDLATTPLEPGDRLFVLPIAANRGTAEVVGAAFFPSSYPITIGETTLRDLVEMAGGFTPNALVHGAYLERETPILDAQLYPGNRELALEPTLRNDIREGALAAAVFDLTRLSTLTFVEKQYMAREFIDNQRVSIDFETAFQDTASPILIQDGDRVVIPYDLGSIYVFGQVPQPGHIPFTVGQTAEHYIALAGGRTAAATDTYVLAASGTVISVDQAGPLRSGDLIFVNREPVAEDRGMQQVVLQERSMEFQENRARSDAQFRIISTVLAAVSTAVTVALLFQK